MTRPFSHVLLVVVTLASGLPVAAANPTGTGPASGGWQPGRSEAASGANIFSTPDSDDGAPRYVTVRTGTGIKGVGFKGGGRSHDDIPNFRQVLTLPTLQPGQRKALSAVFKQYRKQNSDLSAALKSTKEKRDTAGGALSQYDRQQFLTLKREMQALRKQAWEDMRRQLTDQQLRDVEAMRRGELQPATFNGGNNGAMMRQ